MSRRMFRRLWPCILLFGASVAIYCWLQSEKLLVEDEALRDDWVAVRLSKGQKEYIDRRGVHVVVGHYLGDMGALPPNLTDEILNSNLFSPVDGEGKDGMPVVIPPHLGTRMRQLYHINKFNLMASDRIPLNRTLPDVRKKRCHEKYKDLTGLPKVSVVIVFHNEAWSTLLRTVWSVINRSPSSLLEEIVLVDDASTRKFLHKPLDEYVSKLSVPVHVIRSQERVGLIKARLIGARSAKGQILTFLDAHCECTKGWLEALVIRVAEDRTRVVCPVIDIISDETFAYVRSFELHWGAFNWELHFRWYTMTADEISHRRKDLTSPFRTPAMAGGLFAVDKNYFFEIGAYDEKMQVWGGENLELSFRVWQCGGSVEIAPCSHVGHLFRKSSPYSFPGGVTQILYANLARVALVWMDEWKEFFFKYSPEAERIRDRQEVRMRLELRKKLHCKGFKWYLENVWPQHFFPTDKHFFGLVKNVKEEKCLEKPVGKGSLNQPMGAGVLRLCEEGALKQMFVLTENGRLATDESICLDSPDSDSDLQPRVKILACSGQRRQKWIHHTQNKTLEHIQSKKCLDLPSDGSWEKGLVLASCHGGPSQKWDLIPRPWK